MLPQTLQRGAYFSGSLNKLPFLFFVPVGMYAYIINEPFSMYPSGAGAVPASITVISFEIS